MITPQDWERLSAYVDNHLPPAEKSRLEARLAQEPELQAALADLRQVVGALRALPRLKPPRNFTLSPSYRAEYSIRSTPVLRLAAALATLAFFVAVGYDVLATLVKTGMPAAMPEVRKEYILADTTAEAAPENRIAAETPMPAPAALPDAQLTPMADEIVARVAAATETSDGVFVGAEAPPSPAPTPLMSAWASPMVSAVATFTTAAAAQVSAYDLATSAPSITSVPAAVEGGAMAGADVDSGPEGSPRAAPWIFTPVRYVEIGLALAAGILGLAVWRSRRR